MGIYDREYYQGDDAPQGFNLGGRQRMMVTNIVLVTVAIFIIDTLASGNLTNLFALDLDLFRHPWKIYQLLTYGFVHAGPWHVGLNMFMLWMFGRVIEERLGRREFLLFYLAAIIFSGLVWVIVKNGILLSSGQSLGALPRVVGASGGVVAVFIMFVLYYPKQTVYLWGLIAMPAWVIGALVIGQDVLRGFSGGKTSRPGKRIWAALHSHFSTSSWR